MCLAKNSTYTTLRVNGMEDCVVESAIFASLGDNTAIVLRSVN